MKRGRFFVLEGIDGAGTTTQLQRMAVELRRLGHNVHTTAEPSTGPIGSLARSSLKSEHGIDPQTLALLFAADRLDHFRREIEPALLRGSIVLSDRYLLSSLAYQALDCDEDWVHAINRQAPRPDLNLFVRVTAQIAATRRATRGAEPERFEHDNLQRRVAELYERMIQRPDVGPCVVVSGELPPAEVTDNLLGLVRPLIAS